VEELFSWLDMTKGVAKRGWREKAAALPKDTYLPIVSLLGIMDMDTIMAAHRGKGDWLRENLSATWRGTAAFAIKCAERDELALHEEPLLMLGTIHSVKGGEADIVFVSNDLSPQGYQQLTNHDVRHRHSVVRQIYVAVTRAREKLILCAPSTRMSFPEWV
jgi:ATP-dependent exoDNAse (exonuclease V) beta subunit